MPRSLPVNGRRSSRRITVPVAHPPFDPADIRTYPGYRDLTEGQQRFLVAWLENGHNGTQAARQAYPDCTSDVAAATQSYRTLRSAQVRKVLDPYFTAAFKAEDMGVDEATALLARRARAEISDLFDSAGRVLPPTEWPIHVRAAVKTFKVGNGAVHIAMHDPQRPTERILEMLGKAKSVGTGLSELAEALIEDLDRRAGR